ncbi:hypothetical protein PWT90_00019 [Aphanocladium album]|nr:hypothetical protein PWT90_00019 [Aphanocladium album]
MKPESCPAVIMATHFHEIFEFGGFSTEKPPHFAHMKVEINDSTSIGDDPLTYLFTIQRGRSSSSFGEQCATMNGVPNAVVSRAKAISSIIDRDGDLAASCATLSQTEQIRLETAEEVARRFISYEIGAGELPREVAEATKMLSNLLS